MRHVHLRERMQALAVEVEEGFDFEQTLQEAERCLNCDVQTHFTTNLCIECDACIDICPLNCLTITANGEEPELRARLSATRAQPRAGPLCVGGASRRRPA